MEGQEELDEYTNIIELARRANFKKIMIKRDSWNYGNYCIVNEIKLKHDKNEKYCDFVLGFIKYSNGDKKTGSIEGANTYIWRTIKVFDDQDMKITMPKDEQGVK